MLAPTSSCLSCWRCTPQRGGIYASRGRTHEGCDTQRCSIGWSFWYPTRSAYIPLPKCRCGDSRRAAIECRRRRRHQASTTTQCCRDPAWRGSAAAAGCGSSTDRQGATVRRWFPRVVSWLRGLPGCNSTSASLKSTCYKSLQQRRHLRWASDPYRGSEDQERPGGRWMTAPQWWVIDNGCWTDSWLSAQV
jgi:hypothetical protein